MPHIHEKIDFTASVYIVHNDKVLLRFHEKHHKWLVPGGHIELDQDPVETVYKEVKEEVGLDITIIADPVQQYDDNSAVDQGVDLQLPLFINRHRINENHEHVDFIYAAVTESTDVRPAEGESANPEHFRWVTADELARLDDVSERTKYHARAALQKVKSSVGTAAGSNIL